MGADEGIFQSGAAILRSGPDFLPGKVLPPLKMPAGQLDRPSVLLDLLALYVHDCATRSHFLLTFSTSVA